MSELVFISKDLHNIRRRAKSSCSRCSQHGERRQLSPGRGTYLSSARGRNLSLEIDGRQGRNSRRSSSTSRDLEKNKKGPLHCYVIQNGSAEDRVKSPTTYKEAFCSPLEHSRMSRHAGARGFPSSRSEFFSSSSTASNPSTPSKSTSLSSDLTNSITSASSPFSRPSRPSVTRSSSVQNGLVNNNASETTYRDHFTWRY